MVEECGFAVAEAAEMLTKVPAEILGVNKGRIVAGYDADLVVFDENITVTDVFVGGEKI
jgi:N-acetylglucosamine-6-phosphate deacetylase